MGHRGREVETWQSGEYFLGKATFGFQTTYAFDVLDIAFNIGSGVQQIKDELVKKFVASSYIGCKIKFMCGTHDAIFLRTIFAGDVLLAFGVFNKSFPDMSKSSSISFVLFSRLSFLLRVSFVHNQITMDNIVVTTDKVDVGKGGGRGEAASSLASSFFRIFSTSSDTPSGISLEFSLIVTNYFLYRGVTSVEILKVLFEPSQTPFRNGILAETL